jgi:hypothetical protein
MRWMVLILSGLFGGCQPETIPVLAPDVAPADPDSLGLDYASWPKITEKPYPVAIEFITFCRPLLPGEAQKMEAEQRKKHGPHALGAIVVRVNPIGVDKFKAGQPVPNGAVVIKEKYLLRAAKTPPSAVAAMIKREPGYDSEHGDWEYAYEDRSVDAKQKVVRGKIASCIECHKGTRSTDYLFRSYLKAPR